jgi:hypothetical protein
VNSVRHRRAWFLIATLAIAAAVLLLLVPHAHSGNTPLGLTWLPVFFVGLISPLGLFSPRAYLDLKRTPAQPFQPSSFQRPPPLKNRLIF